VYNLLNLVKVVLVKI